MSAQDMLAEVSSKIVAEQPTRRVEDTLRELAYVMHLTRKVKQEILADAPVAVRRKARKHGRLSEAA